MVRTITCRQCVLIYLAIFQLFNLSGNGQLSEEELRGLVKTLSKNTEVKEEELETFVDEVMDSAFQEKEYLTLQEFTALVKTNKELSDLLIIHT